MDQEASPTAPAPESDLLSGGSPEAYDHLCEWFDRELEILIQNFGAFATADSLKKR